MSRKKRPFVFIKFFLLFIQSWSTEISGGEMGDLFDLSQDGLMGFGVQGSSRKNFSPNIQSLKRISQSAFTADADPCLSQERGRKKKKKNREHRG